MIVLFVYFPFWRWFISVCMLVVGRRLAMASVSCGVVALGSVTCNIIYGVSYYTNKSKMPFFGRCFCH